MFLLKTVAMSVGVYYLNQYFQKTHILEKLTVAGAKVADQVLTQIALAKAEQVAQNGGRS